jgi:thioredoxin reductase
MAIRTIWRIRKYNSQVHVYTNGDHELAQALQTRKSPDTGITIEGKGILRLEPDISTSLGVVIHLLDGTTITEAFLYHCPTPQLCGPFARQLDLELAESGAIQVSARAPYMTSMDGVYAAGDCTSLDRRTLFKALSMGEGVAASVAARLEQEQWQDLQSTID